MVAEEFDLFVSYAKEDESRAMSLLDMPLRVFFAPQELLAGDPEIQASLIAALKRSRGILLLWSQWVDKSEWVALEAAIFATDRSIQREKHRTHLAVLDLGGPLLPEWLPCDLILQPAPAEALAEVFKNPNWWEGVHQRHPVGGPLSLAREVLFELPAWDSRVRSVLLRAGPDFSISHLRTGDLRNAGAVSLIRSALLAAITWIVVLACTAMTLWAWVLHFPNPYQGYVPRGILMAAGIAFSATVVLSLRIGVAASVAAGIVSAACGCTAAIIVGFFFRPDPLAGAIAAGSALAAAAAIAQGTHEISGRQETLSHLDWKPFTAALFSFALVALGQSATQAWAVSHGSPPALERSMFAASLGAIVFAPIAFVTGWFAHLRIRLRHWLQALAIGVFVWIFLIAVVAFAAAYVPFGNPFDLRDGAGVGLLAGAFASGLLTIIAPSLRRLVGESASTPWAVALLLAIGFPLLKLFPNIRAGTIYVAACLTAPIVFYSMRWNYRRQVGLKSDTRREL